MDILGVLMLAIELGLEMVMLLSDNPFAYANVFTYRGAFVPQMFLLWTARVIIYTWIFQFYFLRKDFKAAVYPSLVLVFMVVRVAADFILSRILGYSLSPVTYTLSRITFYMEVILQTFLCFILWWSAKAYGYRCDFLHPRANFMKNIYLAAMIIICFIAGGSVYSGIIARDAGIAVADNSKLVGNSYLQRAFVMNQIFEHIIFFFTYMLLLSNFTGNSNESELQ